MLLCRVQSAIGQGFDCFFDYRRLELDHFVTHAFERAPPTHKVAVWPIILLALTFKARNSADRILGTDILIKVLFGASKNRVFRLSCSYLNKRILTIPCSRLSGPEHNFSER